MGGWGPMGELGTHGRPETRGPVGPQQHAELFFNSTLHVKHKAGGSQRERGNVG